MLAILVDSRNFVPDVNYRNVKDLLIPSFGRTPFWSVWIPFCRLPTEDFLDSSGKFSGRHAASANDDNIWPTPFKKVSKHIAIVLVDLEVVDFNLFAKSAHVIQYHWSMPVLALVPTGTTLADGAGPTTVGTWAFATISCNLVFPALDHLVRKFEEKQYPNLRLRSRWHFLLLLASPHTLGSVASSKAFSAAMYLLPISNS